MSNQPRKRAVAKAQPAPEQPTEPDPDKVAATLNSSTTISATNPLFTGQIVVVDLDTGGDVGALRQQSKTYPIKAGTLVRATTGTI